MLDAKTIITKEFHIVAILEKKQYQLLASEARKRDINVNELVTTIVRDWLELKGYK